MTARIRTPATLSRLVSEAVFCAALVMGCTESPSRLDSRDRNSATTIPTVTADELELLVERSDRPVVVELGVGAGCFRCNDMRPHYQKLAESFCDEVDFIRVDINAASHVASKYGATICPSYVVFADRKPIACRQYPTSADLLAREIEQALSETPDSGVSTSARESF